MDDGGAIGEWVSAEMTAACGGDGDGGGIRRRRRSK